MQNYLDPRNDVVFKIFFEKEKNKFLLIDFLETVIGEMQMWNKKFFKERVLHYWSKVLLTKY